MTQPQTCSEHATFLLTDCLHFFALPMLPGADAKGSAWCGDHDAMRPCCRGVCVLSYVARVASFAGFTLAAEAANQMHLAHAAWLATDAQSAFPADQVDCACLAVVAKDSRSAKFASSANRDVKGHRDGQWSAETEASAAPRASSASSLSLPPPGHPVSPHKAPA